MSSSSLNTIGSVLSTGAIIAIVVGSLVSVAILVAIIVVIVCVVKHANRSRNVATQGMIIQSSQTYPYPQTWSHQYPPNTVSVSNYPSTYQTVGPSYAASAPFYNQPMRT